MKLTDLNPHRYNAHVFAMDCPCGRCGTRIRLYVGPRQEMTPQGKCVWKASGRFPDTLTLEPSIVILPIESDECLGWHGYLRNGELVTV